MKKAAYYLMVSLLLLSGCTPKPTPVPPTPTVPPQPTVTLRLSTPSPLPTLTPSPFPSATPSPTAVVTPTQAVRQLEEVAGSVNSISSIGWSPDSSWFAYFDFADTTLHFYNPVTAQTCAYPTPIAWPAPDSPLRWSGNETAVIQVGSRMVTGLPCASEYALASASDREAFTRQYPSISPGGRYKAETRRLGLASAPRRYHGTITDRQTGAVVYQLDYNLPGCGGCGEWLGQWLNDDTLLIFETVDEGWLLVRAGERAVPVTSQIFGQPKDKQSNPAWNVRGEQVPGTNAYHLLLKISDDPTLALLYHSETGQIEKLNPKIAPSISADGRWLEDWQYSATDRLKHDNWFRPIDPPGSAWSYIDEEVVGFPDWSPDHRTAMIPITQDQTTLSQYNMLDGSLLATWKNSQYELTGDSWSPDGAFYALGGRQLNNINHEALFLIQAAPPAPVTLREPPLALPYGLAVEEYRLQDRPGFAANNDALDFKPVGSTMEAVLAKHAVDRENTMTALYYANNLALRPFGYRLETDSWVDSQIPTNRPTSWKLYQGDKLVLSDIFEVGQVHSAASGNDFIMTAQLADRKVLVRKGSIEDYPFSYNDQVGILGDDLLEAVDHSGSPAGYVVIKRAGKDIQHIPTAFGGALIDFMGLWTAQNHWWVEVLSQMDLNGINPVGDIYFDGVSLNQKMGYQDSFNFAYLRDQPFFFYKKSGKIGISYAGQEIPLDYDQVLHDGCCSAGTFNPRESQNMTGFFAEKDGAW
jgi:hypothetical protein